MKKATLISICLLVLFIPYPMGAAEIWRAEADIRNEEQKLLRLKEELKLHRVDLNRLRELRDSLKSNPPFDDIARKEKRKKFLEWEIERRGNTYWAKKLEDEKDVLEDEILSRKKQLDKWMYRKWKVHDPITFKDSIGSIIEFRNYAALIRIGKNLMELVTYELPRRIKHTENVIKELKIELKYFKHKPLIGKLRYRGKMNDEFERQVKTILNNMSKDSQESQIRSYYSSDDMIMEIMPDEKKAVIQPVQLQIRSDAKSRTGGGKMIIKTKFTFSKGLVHPNGIIEGYWENRFNVEIKGSHKDRDLSHNDFNKSSGRWVAEPGPNLRYYLVYLNPSNKRTASFELAHIQ